MPRRMPFRRPRRRPGGARRLPPRLRQAHRMLERGKHLEAAKLFSELASRAEDRQIPQTPLLYLQAGRAYVLGNNPEIGARQIFKAIDLMAAAGNQRRLRTAGQRLIDELNLLGHQQLAADVESKLDQLAPTTEISLEQEPATRSLPGKCKQCGATLHPDEVELLTDKSYACAYCGSRVMMGAS